MMRTNRIFGILIFVLFSLSAHASYILIPMDETQTVHLKSYGIAYWVLEHDVEAWWLLNYRGGSFIFPYSVRFERECKTRGVKYKVTTDVHFNGKLKEISKLEINMNVLIMEMA